MLSLVLEDLFMSMLNSFMASYCSRWWWWQVFLCFCNMCTYKKKMSGCKQQFFIPRLNLQHRVPVWFGFSCMLQKQQPIKCCLEQAYNKKNILNMDLVVCWWKNCWAKMFPIILNTSCVLLFYIEPTFCLTVCCNTVAFWKLFFEVINWLFCLV